MVIVDAKRDRAAELLACADEPRSRRRERFARLENIERVLAHGKESDAAPAVLYQLHGFLDHPGAGRKRRREGRDAIAVLAAEQLVLGNAERLALNV